MSIAPEMGLLSFKQIKQYALEIGWDDAGITYPSIPEEDLEAYRIWMEKGQHAGLHYMENPTRLDPLLLFPGAKRALLFISYYKQEKVSFEKGKGIIASYARGRDYHHLHRRRLKKMIVWLEEKSGLKGIAKGFSDSSPILEKALAVQAGLGWFGKNTLLIHRKFGTFVLLSGILTTLDIPFDPPKMDMRLPRCGSCTKCIDYCPTAALSPYELDANLCLSYHLIESKGSVPEEITKKNPGYAFGCDICQDVCPHNARKPLSTEPTFQKESGNGAYLTLEDLSVLEKYPERLYGTPLQRRGVIGLKANLEGLSS